MKSLTAARRAAAPLVAAYVLAVLAFDQLVAAGTVPLDALASSPDGLLHGRVWTMLSSGLVTVGAPKVLQTAALAAVLVGFAVRHGIRLMLGTALAAHVGSALLAYAGLWLVTGTGLASDPVDLIAPDYGTSCVWFGSLAGLLALELARLRGRPGATRIALAAGALAILAWQPLSPDPLTTAEHLLALAIGAGCGARVGHVLLSESPAGRAPRAGA